MDSKAPDQAKNPSDHWDSYSDSVLSAKHLSRRDKEMRTSSTLFTAANTAKMYVGITVISVSKSISKAGIYTAILGFVYVTLMNMYCVWLLLKARNRFKNK
jgi:amino acid permease